MKFSIIHPTARLTEEFSSPWWIACRSAMESCDSPADVQYVLVVHHSRRELLSGLAQFSAFGQLTVVTNYGRDCLVDQCNAGQLATSGEIIVGNQDDMRFPEHWDTEILKLIPDTSKLIAVQARTDGGRKDLLTIPSIATRALVEAIGLIPTEYESMFSDDEWSAKAWRFGDIVKSPLYFQHLHPVNKTAEMDSVYALENRQEAYQVGWEAFQRRKAAGFPRVPYPGEQLAEVRQAGEYDVSPELSSQDQGMVSKALAWIEGKLGGPVSASPSPSAEQERVIAICTPGDTFSFQWLESFLNLGSRLGQERYICRRYMGHASNVYHARMDLAQRVIEDAKITGVAPQYVLWLDSDNTMLPDQLVGLLRFLRSYPEVDAIFGWCWIRKAHGWTTSAGNFWPDDGVHLMAMNPDALFAGQTDAERWAPKRIEHSGFPCSLIRYEAFAKLGPAAFRPLTKADLPAYFDGNMPEKEVTDDWFCGEDSAWCLQAKKAGMTLIVDPGCKLGHLKLQSQEPDIKGMIAAGFQEKDAKEFRAGFQGPEIEVPQEYERVIS